MRLGFMKTEWYRLLVSRSFWISSLAVCGVLFCVNLISPVTEDVVSQYFLLKYKTLFIAVFVFSNTAYANSMWEDEEHKYSQSMIIRGNVGKYVWTKVCVCFFSGMFSLMMGQMLYFFLSLFRLPLLYLGDDQSLSLADSTCFEVVLTSQKPLLYLFLCAVWLGLLGGVMALISMWLTLIAKNRMFSICIPLAGYYFLITYIGRIGGDLPMFNLHGIFFDVNRVFESTGLSIAYELGLVFLFCIIFGKLIEGHVRWYMGGRIA